MKLHNTWEVGRGEMLDLTFFFVLDEKNNLLYILRKEHKLVGQ